MVRRGLLIAGLLLAASNSPLTADAGVTFYGDTSSGAVFHRPADIGVLSGTGTAVRYSVQPFYPNDDAFCTIYSVQEGEDYDGHIALYEGSFDPASPLTNLIAVNDDFEGSDGGFGVGTSRVLFAELFFVDNYYLVTSGYANDDFGTFSNHIQCDDPVTRILPADGSLFDGRYDGRVVELAGGRFEVRVEWENFANVTGDGYAVPLGSTDSALFWFFEPANWELLVKVVDGCGANNRWWVFMAATTNVEFTLRITDKKPNPDVTYTVHNSLGSTANVTRADINAFATCP